MSDYQGNIVIKNPATPTGPSAYGRAPGMWKLNEVAYWIKQGVWPNPAITPDIYFPYVSLLLSTTSLGNASNNLFVDSSGAFNPLARAGNAAQGSFTPYSTNWSNYFDGNASTSISVSDASAFDFGTGDFTIECWAFVTAQASSFSMIAATTGVNQYWGFGSVGSGGMTMFGGGVDIYSGSGSTPALNTWNHLVWQRSGGIASMYLNGVRVYNASYTADFGSSATGFKVGRSDSYNNYYTTGYISNMRVVKGTGVYSGATITVPTSPLTAISGTSLLTCQSNRFRDASSGNLTVTASGNVAVQDFGPFSPVFPGASYNQSDIANWSGWFNGGTDRLQVPVTSNMYLGTTYTIEAWAYYNSSSYGARPIFNQMEPFQGGFAFLGFGLNTSGQLVAEYRPGTSGAVTTITGPTITPYTWFHIALVCDNSSAKLYINGTQVGSTATFGDYPSAKTNTVAVGSWGSGWNDGGIPAAAWIGYISNVRVVKGAAVYTSNFTPPTTPLTAISGTVLLTCQNAAFSDNSSVNNILTPVSNATVTGNSPFNTVGFWSNYFDGSGDYIYAPNNTALNVWDSGSGSFTVEAWIFATASISNNVSIVGKATLDGNIPFSGWALQVFSGCLNVNTASNNRLFSNSTAVPLNQWVHVALVKSGSTVSIYQNGTRVGTVTNSNAYSNTTDQVHIAIDRNPVGPTFTGYISNLRMVKGTAVYDPSQATITVPTTPLTAITNTSLLTCQNGRFIDNSANAFALTVYGNTSTQSFDPFYTATVASNGGSVYFDGSGDYLTSPTSPAYDFGSSNFTIEGWFYFTNATANALQTIYSNYTSFSPPGSIYFGKHTSSGGTVAVFLSSFSTGSPLLSDPNLPPNNAWVHYAFVRNGNTFTLYRNGVSVASNTFSGAATAGACPAFVGAAGDVLGTYHFAGYMSGFRITKSAVYTAAFTPPTAPLTPSANTTLLLNGMNAGAFDATTINDMETVGNAQVRYPSPFAPANYYAGSFDGAGDYLTVPYSTALQLPGDFTIEAWVYLNSRVTSFPCIVANYSTYAVNGGFALFAGHNFNTTKYTVSFNGSFPVLTSTSDITYGAWTHIAVVRSGTTLRLYINGVSEATATNSATVTGTGDNWWIATSGDSTTSSYINGSISNLRVVKGTAVYTSNFTPPTSPLTAISGTSLLTCQNKTFIDNSTNAIAITSYGNATAGAISPFTATGGTSMYFDGTGDYLKAPNSDAFAFRTGDFTVEMWAYFADSTATNRPLFDTGVSSNTGRLLIRQGNDAGTSNVVNAFVSGTTVGSPTISFNQWTHVAVVRQSGTVKIYINGTGGTGVSASADLTQNGCLVGAFYDQLAWNFTGYIDDLRVTRGVARYTANFTPPTQPFPIY